MARTADLFLPVRPGTDSALFGAVLHQLIRHDWLDHEFIDDHTVGSILRDEVQIAFRGDGPMSKRELVPLTAGAHELLYGSQRDSARGAPPPSSGCQGVTTVAAHG